MEIFFLVLSVASAGIMVYAWSRVNGLRKRVPGGIVKSTSNILSELIGLFTAGYLAIPFFPMLPQASRDILIGIMLLFAAIFAVIVINLFDMVAASDSVFEWEALDGRSDKPVEGDGARGAWGAVEPDIPVTGGQDDR